MEYFCGFVCFERAVFFRLCITLLWNVWLFDCNAIVFTTFLRCEPNTFRFVVFPWFARKARTPCS